MGALIRNEDIAVVRERTRLDEVIAEHVTLKAAGGGSLKGLCPFHEERTPSFHVTPSKGFYYCFGCGEGGDAIDFLMNHDHLSFSETVEKLAGRIGYSLHYEGGGPGDKPDGGNRRALLSVNTAAAKFFTEALRQDAAEPARQFLADKGFGEQTWDQFSVGYASRSGLVAHLRSRGFADREIVESGIAGDGDRGLYDRFRHRVVWPIQDLSGDVVGFGARRLDEQGPKYLNTPETVVYKKSNILYGLHEAKKAIAKAQRAVVVEGYTDVMACHLAGVDTAVATCGTAFGSGHVQVLRRILMDDARGEVVFTFDGDEAGRKAALRAYSEDQSFAARTSVAIAEGGLDPCDLRLQSGDAAVRDLIESRQPLFEFVLQSKLSGIDLRTAEGRAAGIRAVAPVLAGMKDRTLQPEYARQVSGRLGVEPEQVMAEVRQHIRSRRRGASESRRSLGTQQEVSESRQTSTVDPQDSTVQRLALKLLVQSPEQVAQWLETITEDCFTVPQALSVFQVMERVGLGRAEESDWVRLLLDASPDDRVRGLIHSLVTEPMPVTSLTQRYSVGIIARLLDRAAERGSQSLRAALGDPEIKADSSRETAVLTDLMEVEEYRRSLREHWAADES
jgi:DNA primase